jgi:hypothetical protein
MEEYKINENKILEELTEVTTAKRVARMVNHGLFIWQHIYEYILIFTIYSICMTQILETVESRGK